MSEESDSGKPLMPRSKPYRPSNGMEGEMFHEKFCYQCSKHEDAGGDTCPIAMNAFFFDVGEKNYPPEWQYGPGEQPTCTAFSANPAPPEEVCDE